MSNRFCLTLVLAAAVLACPRPAPAQETAPATTQGARPFDTAGAVADELRQLQDTLVNDASARQDQRDEAARRLVARQSDPARAILAEALDQQNPKANKAAWLAAARAVAGDASPDPALVDDLFALFTQDRNLCDAAAAALANYRSNPKVTDGLLARATDRAASPAARQAAIRALGAFPGKDVAQALVEKVLARADEPAAIRDAAADALTDLTGLREFGRDAQRWRQWWQQVGSRPDAQLQAEWAATRARYLESVRQRNIQFVQEVRALLARQYRQSRDTQAGQELLLDFLKGSDPALRGLGAQLVQEDFSTGRPLKPGTREQLRRMIGDSAADVRLEVARVLTLINDKEAVNAALTQIVQEPQPEIRATLADVLGRAQNLVALPTLKGLLLDSSAQVAEAAAKALRQLGPALRVADPRAAADLADELIGVLNARTAPESTGLRDALIDAVGSLRDPRVLQWLPPLLKRSEAVAVRRAALRALGELASPKAQDWILSALDNDPDPSVRLEAVNALANTATWASAEPLFKRMNSRDEDEALRNKAWDVLSSLFPTAPKDTLKDWPDRFKNNPERQFIIRKALSDMYQKSGEMDRWAYNQENIGVSLMELKRHADAAIYFRNALDHWLSQRDAPLMVTQSNIIHLLNSLLLARKYGDAVQFAAEMTNRDPTNQQTVGRMIVAEAARLRDDRKYDDAWSLIQEARKMSPPLNERYQTPLLDIETEVKDKRTSPGG